MEFEATRRDVKQSVEIVKKKTQLRSFKKYPKLNVTNIINELFTNVSPNTTWITF